MYSKLFVCFVAQAEKLVKVIKEHLEEQAPQQHLEEQAPQQHLEEQAPQQHLEEQAPQQQQATEQRDLQVEVLLGIYQPIYLQ